LKVHHGPPRRARHHHEAWATGAAGCWTIDTMTPANPAARTWTMLRQTRHAPPGYASSAGSRRSTYRAALEQAEQMFAAAVQVSVATRPLQVFYGLSQGGRAVTAAATVGRWVWSPCHARTLTGSTFAMGSTK